MGMYTELRFAAKLKKDTPKQVIHILTKMADGQKLGGLETPSHPLFGTSRWEGMLVTDSYYFSADTQSTIRYDQTAGAYYLTIQCNLKNYDGEIEKFVEWVMPYVDATEGEHLGHTRYESNDIPDMLYAKGEEW
jgi:hypothetical protein